MKETFQPSTDHYTEYPTVKMMSVNNQLVLSSPPYDRLTTTIHVLDTKKMIQIPTMTL